MRKFIGVFSSAALLASLLAAAVAPSVGAVTCTSTGYWRDGMNLTAAQIGGDVTGTLDATGCNIGVYYDATHTGNVTGAEIYGANYFGVLVNGGTVDVTDSDIHHIGESPFNGAQHGVAVYYAYGSSSTGTVSGNTISDYQKGGIVANGAGTFVTITDNTVTGLGSVNFIAQNGIQLGWGSMGEVKRNDVSDNWYTPSDWVSAGILLFQTNDITVQDNSVADNQVGVGIESWCWLALSASESSASENKIVANTISGAQVGVSVGAIAWERYSECDPAANNNKVVNNTITASAGDVGVYVWTYDASGSFGPSAVNNKVTRNVISGYTDATIDEGSETKSHANVFAP